MNVKESLRKSLAGAALVAVVTLGGAGSASAEQAGPVTTSVSPGGRSCCSPSSPRTSWCAPTAAPPTPSAAKAQWIVHHSYDRYGYQIVCWLSGNGSYQSEALSRDFFPQ